MKYRDIIRAEFQRRREIKTFYSLRRFAQDLGIKPMHLSAIFKDKKGIGKEKSYLIARALGLTPKESEYFRLLAAQESARAQCMRNLTSQGLKRKWLRDCPESIRQRYENV